MTTKKKYETKTVYEILTSTGECWMPIDDVTSMDAAWEWAVKTESSDEARTWNCPHDYCAGGSTDVTVREIVISIDPDTGGEIDGDYIEGEHVKGKYIPGKDIENEHRPIITDERSTTIEYAPMVEELIRRAAEEAEYPICGYTDEDHDWKIVDPTSAGGTSLIYHEPCRDCGMIRTYFSRGREVCPPDPMYDAPEVTYSYDADWVPTPSQAIRLATIGASSSCGHDPDDHDWSAPQTNYGTDVVWQTCRECGLQRRIDSWPSDWDTDDVAEWPELDGWDNIIWRYESLEA